MATVNNWNADTYSSKHNYVTNNGISVLELMNPKSNEIIIDLGCGSGELTNKIAKSALAVIGLDISENMIIKAKHDFPEIHFIQHDAELPFPIYKPVDCVFSNASLNWMMNADAVAENIDKKYPTMLQNLVKQAGSMP